MITTNQHVTGTCRVEISVVHARFFNEGVSVTSDRDDVKILRITTSSRCHVTGSVNSDF